MELEKLFEIIIQSKQENILPINNFIETVLAPCLETEEYYFVRNSSEMLSIYRKVNKIRDTEIGGILDPDKLPITATNRRHSE